MPALKEQPHAPAQPPVMGSLLDDLGAPVLPPRPSRPRAQDQLRAIVRRLWHDRNLRWARRAAAVALALAILAGGTLGVLALIPRPVPDYLDDPMDEVLDYTLLTDDFNRLPLERRLELIKDLVQRMRSMSSSDSAVMAAFAATIRDEMRRQMEHNARQLAADVLDVYSRDYARVPPERQGEFLDQAIIGFTRTMEQITGEDNGLPADESERLSKIKDQAKRDQERMNENKRPLSAGRASRLFELVHRDETATNPVQRGEMAKFMRDMTRHLRGEDITTGKPLPGGG